MVHIIVALECEARPLIEHFRLHHDDRPGLFKRYIKKSVPVSLTLSGTGGINAAAAVTETSHYYPGQHAWLNIGVAGNAHYPLGSGFLIGKLHCRSSKKSWYPQILFNPPLPIAELISLEQPSEDYSEALYDMEAVGFYTIASRCALSELIMCIKIVSDNDRNPIEKISKTLINNIITERLHEIKYCVTELELLQKALSPADITTQFTLLTKQTHFTRYQKNRLRTLLLRWHALTQQQPGDILNQKESAQQILEKMSHYLDRQTISYRDV